MTDRTKKKIILVVLLLLGLILIIWRRFIPSSPQPVNFIVPTHEHTHVVGDIFTFPIEIKNSNSPVNAVQADLSFDALRLQAIAISTQGSFATIFLDEVIDNRRGFIRLTGGLPNPGYQGSGVFGTVYFRTIAPGKAEIHFLESCQILANDGRGTNTVTHFPHTSIEIQVHEDSAKLSNDTVIVPQEDNAGQIKLFDRTDKLPEPAIAPHASHSPLFH